MADLSVKCNDNIVMPLEKDGVITVQLNTYLITGDNVLELKNANYEIVTTGEGASIDENGLLTICGTFNAGDVNGTDLIVRVKAERDGKAYSFDKAIHVSPAPEVEVTNTVKSDFSVLTQKRDTNPEAFLYVNDCVTKMDKIEIETSRFMFGERPGFYQVCRKKNDGSLDKADVYCEDKVLSIDTKDCVAVEVSPVFKFVFGYEDNQEYPGAIRVYGHDEYSTDSVYGFVGERIASVGHIGFAGDYRSSFVFTVPEGFYDVKIHKADEERSTIRINGGSVGTNVGNPGKGGRCGIHPYTYLVEEIHATGGIITLSMDERGRTVKQLEIRRSTTLRERRPHIFIGGDSTASCYYPIEEAEPVSGRFQTGWGQVFSQFTTEKAVVISIAGGGTFAKSWYGLAFQGVLQHGMPGDVFLIEEGINDRTYSNEEEMAEYLLKMIDECKAVGILPVLVTAMQTPKFWKAPDGTELPEFARPYGSGLHVFAERIRKLAKDSNTHIIDGADISGELYKILGRTYVATHFHIFNPDTNTEEDTLHLSYDGAINMAGIVATELENIISRDKPEGCKINSDCFNEQEEIEFKYLSEDKIQTVHKITRAGKKYRAFGL